MFWRAVFWRAVFWRAASWRVGLHACPWVNRPPVAGLVATRRETRSRCRHRSCRITHFVNQHADRGLRVRIRIQVDQATIPMWVLQRQRPGKTPEGRLGQPVFRPVGQLGPARHDPPSQPLSAGTARVRILARVLPSSTGQPAAAVRSVAACSAGVCARPMSARDQRNTTSVGRDADAHIRANDRCRHVRPRCDQHATYHGSQGGP